MKNAILSSPSGTTTEPLIVPAVNCTDNSGDWFRLPKPKQKYWGLSRTTWNELTDSGQVKSITLRKKHAQRGIKLIYRPSAESYLKSLMTSGAEGKAE
jgi:hypothetical protein